MSETPHEQPAGPPPNPYAERSARDAGARRIWIWAVAAVIALVFTGIVAGFVLSQMQARQAEAEGATTSEQAVPEAEFQWPANMATGGIVFIEGDDGIDVVRSEAPAAETEPQPGELAQNADGTTPAHIRLYLDYRCPYCALFEQANAATLEQAVESGQAVLEIHPLSFLDKVDPSDYYSSRASGAVACVATSQPEQTWNAHSALMSPGFQPAENVPGHDNAALVAELDDATGGLTDEARSCIEGESFVPFARTLNDWVFANPVPGAEDPELKVTGTPFALVDGVPYGGAPDDSAAFEEFLEERGIELS